MSVEPYITQPGDGWFTIAAKLAPAGITRAQRNTFAMAIAVANGGDFNTVLHPGRILWYDTSTIPAPPDPEPVAKMLVGATVDRERDDNGNYTQTWVEAREAFETQLGKRLQITRRFLGLNKSSNTWDIIRSWSTLSTLSADPGYSQHISMKGTHTQAAWVRFLNTIPNDGQPRWITSHHEPEGDMTVAAYQAMQATLLAALDEVGRPDLHPCVTYTGWWEFDATTAGTTTADLFPPDPARWVLGLDKYDVLAQRTLQWLCEPTLALWRQAGGTRWAIPEFGTKRVGQDGARFITEGLNWARGEGCEFAAYFHAPQGDNGPWWLDDPTMLAAYAAQIT